jgi:dinuclear metal center YbgI/SA1388 family protein
MQLGTLAAQLDELLDVASYAGVDGAVDGIQVGRPDDPIDRVGLAVDAAEATIAAAADAGVDALIVHHGVFWGDRAPLEGVTLARVRALVAAEIALYAAHLPLDAHPSLGNAAGLARTLGVTDTDPFGSIAGVTIGRGGRFPSPQSTEAVCTALGELEGAVASPTVLRFGPDPLDRVAIVTGAGGAWLEEAAAGGYDVLISGEPKHRHHHLARELGITAIFAGHYATETFGVRALAEPLAAWGLEPVWLPHPVRI